jgi:ATP-dependent DNA ligase
MIEGIVSKRADAPYAPGNRGLWVNVKCLQREEFRPQRSDRFSLMQPEPPHPASSR